MVGNNLVIWQQKVTKYTCLKLQKYMAFHIELQILGPSKWINITKIHGLVHKELQNLSPSKWIAYWIKSCSFSTVTASSPSPRSWQIHTSKSSFSWIGSWWRNHGPWLTSPITATISRKTLFTIPQWILSEKLRKIKCPALLIW